MSDPPSNEVTAQKQLYAYENIGNRKDYTAGTGSALYYCTNNRNQYEHTDSAADCVTPWTESFGYDPDGNLTPDGTYTYVWDAENRLKEVRRTTPTSGSKKLTFAYDYLGRRVEKIVYNYSGGQWNETSHLRFVYDGWNLVLNGNASNATAQKYTWGLDLSGQAGNTASAGIHGAGGIGGLLACDRSGTSYWYVFDGNGNVGQIIGADPLELAAAYEYDPYGNALRLDDSNSSGIVWDNPFRFSTKYRDGELTGNELYYYGYEARAEVRRLAARRRRLREPGSRSDSRPGTGDGRRRGPGRGKTPAFFWAFSSATSASRALFKYR